MVTVEVRLPRGGAATLLCGSTPRDNAFYDLKKTACVLLQELNVTEKSDFLQTVNGRGEQCRCSLRFVLLCVYLSLTLLTK